MRLSLLTMFVQKVDTTTGDLGPDHDVMCRSRRRAIAVVLLLVAPPDRLRRVHYGLSENRHAEGL